MISDSDGFDICFLIFILYTKLRVFFDYKLGGMMMATVSQLMSKKKDEINYSLSSSSNVLKALEMMSEANISAVMVTDGGKIVGIFTERDYTRKCELKGLKAKETFLRDLMTERMVTVSPETSIDQCMKLMMEYQIRHLPVVEKDSMVGMVSMRDVVEIILADKDLEIKGLENHILSSGFST